jgi:hypothetical protein
MLGLVAAAVLFPPLKYRWVYLQTNFFTPNNVEAAIELTHRAARDGYNGIVYCDSKIQSLDPFPDFYKKAVNRFRAVAKSENIEVIPGIRPVGYADGMLHLDPSLIESLPCKNVAFTVHGGQLTPDLTNFFVNGDFTRFKGDTLQGLTYQDAIGKATFVDRQVEHGGTPSLRIDDPKNASDSHGNCRLVEALTLQPFHQYRVSFWAKSQNFESASDFRVLALKPDGSSLSFQNVDLQPTQGWTQHSVVFDSLDNPDVKIYIGVWGGKSGKMWLSSISVTDAGFLNVDRRALCPVEMTDSAGRRLREGIDYAKVVDPGFGSIPYAGEFDFQHPSPLINVLNGALKEGDLVTASYDAATATDSGKTSLCLADPKTPQMEKAEIARAEDLFHSAGYLVEQDEMRVQGWCGACAQSGKTTAQLLADDIHRSVGFLNGKQAFIWSDMFDPFHNAAPNYYLCKGSLVGTWKGLPPGTIILNWNSGHAVESLSFFHQLGLGQILAGYYDAPVENIKPWLKEAKSIGNLQGVMYTTWTGNYGDLESFAKAAWGSSG